MVGGGRHIRGVVRSAPRDATTVALVVPLGRTSQPRGCGVRPPHHEIEADWSAYKPARRLTLGWASEDFVMGSGSIS